MVYENVAPASLVPPAGRPFSGSAITAFILGVLWLGGIGSIVGLFLSISAMRETRAGLKSGQGLAVAALIVSILGLLSAVVFLAMLFVAANETANQMNEISRQLGKLTQVPVRYPQTRKGPEPAGTTRPQIACAAT